MQLDHSTGELDGEVLRGPFAGRSLASLGLAELLDLLADCQREDPRSVPLLETYLDRRAARLARPRRRRKARRTRSEAGASGAMDEATACSILGLSPGASADEIKAAHRRLMTKLHPDHGGSELSGRPAQPGQGLSAEPPARSRPGSAWSGHACRLRHSSVLIGCGALVEILKGEPL